MAAIRASNGVTMKLLSPAPSVPRSTSPPFLTIATASSLPHPIIASDTCTQVFSLVTTSSSSITPSRARRCSITRLPSTTDLTTLHIPSLHCNFPAFVHPDYGVVKESCDAWIEAVAEPRSASASRFLHDCLLPLLVCRFVPTAISRQRLVHVIKAVAWLMIADDDDDHPGVLGSDYATTSHRADLVMAILRAEEDVAHQTSFDCSFLAKRGPGFATKCARRLRALAELWHEMRTELSPCLRARFISTMADYFEGVKVQAYFRKEVAIPDMESYMEIRRQASFTVPCFVLMEYALGIEIDEATFNNPLICKFRNVVLDHISLCNDIVSCPIEIGKGDYFNLPFILYNSEVSPQKFKSFQATVNHVAQMVQDLNNHAIFLLSTIRKDYKGFQPHIFHPILAYMDGLSNCMSGAHAWFFETARYH